MFGLLSPVARAIKANGVVGLNERNGDFVLQYNKRRFYPRVDDKLLTKRLAEAAGIATPTLYAVFETSRDAANAAEVLAPYEDFVIKPSQGSGGDGIVVISGRTRTGGYYRSASGKLISEEELLFHLQNTISGVYSLGGQPDVAMVEYRVQFDPVFEKIAFQGVPDVRIIVFLGVPVMAMVRLPTRMSSGKANLHQGAIGAGIDIATGRTLTAVWKNDIVTEHPDTLNPVQNVEIPHWDKMLELAARSMDLTELGYQGIDIVLDRDRGPADPGAERAAGAQHPDRQPRRARAAAQAGGAEPARPRQVGRPRRLRQGAFRGGEGQHPGLRGSSRLQVSRRSPLRRRSLRSGRCRIRPTTRTAPGKRRGLSCPLGGRRGTARRLRGPGADRCGRSRSRRRAPGPRPHCRRRGPR